MSDVSPVVRCRPCEFPADTKFDQVLSPVLRCLPVLPDTHSQTESDVTVQPLAQTFHTSDSEVVYPSSDELIEFEHLMG